MRARSAASIGFSVKSCPRTRASDVGFLTGLQQSGRLPEFAVITGVSTGALMAPFLFAGPEGLTTLKVFYTAPDVEQLVGKRSILRFLRRPGFVSSKPVDRRAKGTLLAG